MYSGHNAAHPLHTGAVHINDTPAQSAWLTKGKPLLSLP